MINYPAGKRTAKKSDQLIWPHKFQYNNNYKVAYNMNVFHFSVTHTVLILSLIYLQVFLCLMKSTI